jgi:hypothetical protein
MRSILEELFYGNVCPSTDCRHDSTQKRLLQELVANHHHILYKTLTDEQKAMLTEFDNSDTELLDINECEIFVYAFKLGMRIAIEVLTTETD